MLTRIEISNYRCFESFHLEGLSRVNLFVGKNNSGKTAILEAIQFLTSGGDPAVLAEVAERRGEVVLSREDPRSYSGRGSAVDIAHFFFGHTLSLDAAFSFKGDNGYAPVTVKAIAQKTRREESSERRPSRSDEAGFFLRISGPAAASREVDRKFRISREGGVDLEISSRLRRTSTVRRGRGHQVRFVGPESLNSIDMAIMWDEIALTGQEVDVAGAIRLLEPNLESVHFLTGMFASGYFPSRGGIVVGMKGQEARVPLGSMGDGMRRLLALATSLAFTREGCLLVDEIDTGLHYTIMSDMWKLVLKKAIAAGNQVFATTHSWDCIEGLSRFLQDEPELASDVAIHKIDRAIPHSVAFPGESIVRMVKSDVDPR